MRNPEAPASAQPANRFDGFGYGGLMWSGISRVVRYAWSWSRQRAPVTETEVQVPLDSTSVPGSFYMPHRSGSRLPGWVLLHGITRPGRKHPTLERFARALASTPAAVLVPEIPPWRELSLDPDHAVPTIQAAILALSERPETAPDRIGLIGFSFGSPQALVASTDPRLQGKLKAVVGFGGYFDLRRTLRFLFTGQHDWNGTTYRLRPDPYGRWVAGANYLTETEGFRDSEDVAVALRELAAYAGDVRANSWDPVYDEIKDRLEAQVASERRPLYRLFVPSREDPPVDPDAGRDLADALADAARRRSSLLDPAPFLERVSVPVRLIHGKQDHLIPFTETLRMAESFPAGHDVDARITGLFAHSNVTDGKSLLGSAAEQVSLLNGLRDVFELV